MQMTEEKVWTRAVLADGTSAPQRRSDRSRQTAHRILAGSLGALLVLLVAGYRDRARRSLDIRRSPTRGT